jgi:uncharacterized protein YecE (DUF72 family)
MTSGVTATPPSVTGLQVGTSGWSYPSWRPGFYPAELRPPEFLSYYAQRFSTVELNTTGYRIPAEHQFERWGEAVPDGFSFAVKLQGNRPGQVGAFVERVGALGDRLGPIRVVLTTPRDDGMLELLRGSLDPGMRLAFDLRHESWDGIEPELAAAGAVRVDWLDGGAPFRYVRLREPPYSDEELETWAGRLAAIPEPVYAYFRHEDEPTAPRYAARLLELSWRGGAV